MRQTKAHVKIGGKQIMPHLWHLEVSWAYGLSNGTNKSPHKISFAQKEVVAVFWIWRPLPYACWSGWTGHSQANRHDIFFSCATHPPSFRSEREEHACKLLLHLLGPATRVIEISRAGTGSGRRAAVLVPTPTPPPSFKNAFRHELIATSGLLLQRLSAPGPVVPPPRMWSPRLVYPLPRWAMATTFPIQPTVPVHAAQLLRRLTEYNSNPS